MLVKDKTINLIRNIKSGGLNGFSDDLYVQVFHSVGRPPNCSRHGKNRISRNAACRRLIVYLRVEFDYLHLSVSNVMQKSDSDLNSMFYFLQPRPIIGDWPVRLLLFSKKLYYEYSWIKMWIGMSNVLASLSNKHLASDTFTLYGKISIIGNKLHYFIGTFIRIIINLLNNPHPRIRPKN